MKNIVFLIFLPLFFSCKMNTSSEKDHVHVKIVLDTEEVLPESETIYLTGNQSELGSWNPSGLAMIRRAETRWEQTFHIDSAHVEFKFTLGSFDREAVSNKGVVPSNSIIYAVRDTEIYFVIGDWENNKTP